jgi:hypothetical protein
LVGACWCSCKYKWVNHSSFIARGTEEITDKSFAGRSRLNKSFQLRPQSQFLNINILILIYLIVEKGTIGPNQYGEGSGMNVGDIHTLS